MNQLRYILLMLPVLLMLGGCEKDAEPKEMSISMKLGEPTQIGRTFVQLNGSLTGPGSVKETGFIWWKQGDKEHASEVALQDSLSAISTLLEGLKPDMAYEYCMYAGNGIDRLTGQTGSFKTVLYSEPLLSELTVDKEALNRFTCRVKDDGIGDSGDNLLSKGICWNTEGNPTIEDQKIEIVKEPEEPEESEKPEEDTEGSKAESTEGKDKSFTVSILDLQDTTTYYLRAFAINDSSYLSYSQEIKVVTGKTRPKIGEIVLTDSDRKEFKATLEDIGGGEILSKGFCWNTSGMPTIADSHKAADEDFTAILTELDTHALYHVRAYAENAYGIVYSEELTVEFISSPTVGAVERTDPEANVFRSLVLDNGGSEVTEKGFCWNRGGNPSLSDHVVKADRNFMATISDMESGTYYIRAYAKNKAGVGYGEELSITIHVITIPEVSEVRILDETVNLLRSSVISTGGSAITGRGFCWSTHDYPDLSDNVLPTGESFMARLGALNPGVYYIRAYASNKAGVGYSRTLKLDTRVIPELGEVMTVDAATHTYRSMLLSNGGGNVDSWGFCWNTEGMPTIGDHAKSANEMFIASLGELSPGVYYVRAYAKNEIGVGYGREFVITVAEPEPNPEPNPGPGPDVQE